MLLIVYLLFFIEISFIVADKYKKEFAEILPVVFSGFVLILYLLAFFNRMWFSDIIAITTVVVISVYIIKNKKEKIPVMRKIIMTPAVVVFFSACVIGVIILSRRGIFSADEKIFWAIDVRTIFSLQGFSPKGFNTVPRFGDYPPAAQIIESWFMHIMGLYKEGFLYGAYFIAMQIYTLPLIKKVPSDKKVVFLAIGWMFVIYSFGPNVMQDISVDVLMAVVYGSALILIFSWKNKGIMEYISIALILSVLILIKSIGVQWAVFAIIFMLLLEMSETKLNKKHFSFLIPAITWISWWGFCKLFERTTYLTETLKDSVQGQGHVDYFKEYGRAMLDSFVSAIWIKQQSNIIGIGLSVVACFLIYLSFIYLMGRKKLIDKKLSKKLFYFVLLSGIVEYLILLFSVETMFINEIRYVEPETMILLLKRYGAPWVIGCLMLILFILFERTEGIKISLKNKIITENKAYSFVWITVIIISVFMSPIFQEIGKYIIYPNETVAKEESLEERRPDIVKTVNLLRSIDNPQFNKILVVNDETEWESQHGWYLNYYCAPMPISNVVVSDGEKLDLYSYADKAGFTGVCFVSNNDNWSILKDYNDNGKDIKPYVIYDMKIMSDNILLEKHR